MKHSTLTTYFDVHSNLNGDTIAIILLMTTFNILERNRG